MRSIQSTVAYPLSSVKPLEGLVQYRSFCVNVLKTALQKGIHPRTLSPVDGSRLIPAGEVDGLHFGRCAKSGSLFLTDLPAASEWPALLSEIVRFRHAPKGYHAGVTGSRIANVYAPKLDWIQTTLRMQELRQPRILEVSTQPSDFTDLLKNSGTFREVRVFDEGQSSSSAVKAGAPADAAILLESLDRSYDPKALLASIKEAIVPGGLLFLTALVSSGFDMQVLGFNNLYLCPPDRTNCFSLQGLESLLKNAGFSLLEISTPGVLDMEIVQAHLKHDPSLSLSTFERYLLSSEEETQHSFQSFLQERGLSSFARIVGRKNG